MDAAPTRFSVPDSPSLEGIEKAWMERWAEAGTYRFDETATRDKVFSSDTPLRIAAHWPRF